MIQNIQLKINIFLMILSQYNLCINHKKSLCYCLRLALHMLLSTRRNLFWIIKNIDEAILVFVSILSMKISGGDSTSELNNYYCKLAISLRNLCSLINKISFIMLTKFLQLDFEK